MSKFDGLASPMSFAERVRHQEGLSEFISFKEDVVGKHKLIDDDYVYVSQGYSNDDGFSRIRYVLEIKTTRFFGNPIKDEQGNFLVGKWLNGRMQYVPVSEAEMPKRILHDDLRHLLTDKLHL
ncbi:MAG: hypothetical protein PHY92_07115 [Alphaproteobacteria bacterium]|nr:hypothetical protein [Alphaproteobacteria bacterium]